MELSRREFIKVSGVGVGGLLLWDALGQKATFPWCAPCRMVAPIVEGLARDYQGKVAFGKLDVDRNPSLAMKYRIMSIPTLLVFKDGQLVD